MNDRTLKTLDADIRSRRDEVSRLRGQLEDIEDYLDILEARRRALRQPKLTQAKVAVRYGVADEMRKRA